MELDSAIVVLKMQYATDTPEYNGKHIAMQCKAKMENEKIFQGVKYYVSEPADHLK